MQEELELARPLLAEAAKDTLVTMEQIEVCTPSSEIDAESSKGAEPGNT